MLSDYLLACFLVINPKLFNSQNLFEKASFSKIRKLERSAGIFGWEKGSSILKLYVCMYVSYFIVLNWIVLYQIVLYRVVKKQEQQQ